MANVEKIQDAGYRFFFSDLDQALANQLGGCSAPPPDEV